LGKLFALASRYKLRSGNPCARLIQRGIAFQCLVEQSVQLRIAELIGQSGAGQLPLPESRLDWFHTLWLRHLVIAVDAGIVGAR